VGFSPQSLTGILSADLVGEIVGERGSCRAKTTAIGDWRSVNGEWRAAKVIFERP